MNAPVFIVWDGCDGYIETTDAVHYNGAHEFRAFPVVPVSIDAVPIDEDGERDFTGFFVTTSGNVYREV